MPRALERLLPPLGKVNRSSDNAYCRISALGELEVFLFFIFFCRFAVVVVHPLGSFTGRFVAIVE